MPTYEIETGFIEDFSYSFFVLRNFVNWCTSSLINAICKKSHKGSDESYLYLSVRMFLGTAAMWGGEL